MLTPINPVHFSGRRITRATWCFDTPNRRSGTAESGFPRVTLVKSEPKTTAGQKGLRGPQAVECALGWWRRCRLQPHGMRLSREIVERITDDLSGIDQPYKAVAQVAVFLRFCMANKTRIL
jgi:hypothetical protein